MQSYQIHGPVVPRPANAGRFQSLPVARRQLQRLAGRLARFYGVDIAMGKDSFTMVIAHADATTTRRFRIVPAAELTLKQGGPAK